MAGIARSCRSRSARGHDCSGVLRRAQRSKSAEKAITSKWWGRGKGIRDLAKSVGAQDEYDWVYTQLCDYAHSGSRTLHMFVKHVSEDSIQMVYRPQKSHALVLPWSITKWLCEVVALTNKAYDLGIDDTVDLALQLTNHLIAKSKEARSEEGM